MLEFLIDNIFVFFDGRVFQQTVGIPMGTNCAPLLVDLFLNSYEADFITERKRNNRQHSYQFPYKRVSKLYKMLTGCVNDDYLDFSLWQNQNVM